MKIIIDQITSEDYILEKDEKLFHFYNCGNCWKIRYYLDYRNIAKMEIVPDFKAGFDRILELTKELET